MKVHVLSAYPHPHDFTARWIIAAAQQDRFGVHALVDDPANADLIIFAEGHSAGDPYYMAVFRHAVWRRYKAKCFLYHDEDYAVPIIPGLYPSLETSNYNPAHAVGAPYMARVADSPAKVGWAPIPHGAILCSFASIEDSTSRQFT